MAVQVLIVVMYGAMATEFQQLLRSASGLYPRQQDLADALGISLARLNRALNQGDYTLNIGNCLRLARLANEPPSAVLRKAGKVEIADLIEQLYGASDLTPIQREVLHEWELLPPEIQAATLTLLRAGNASRRRDHEAARSVRPAPPGVVGPPTRRHQRAG